MKKEKERTKKKACDLSLYNRQRGSLSFKCMAFFMFILKVKSQRPFDLIYSFIHFSYNSLRDKQDNIHSFLGDIKNKCPLVGEIRYKN